MKSQIIEHLGQTDILMPSLIANGLAANDRVKVRMSALQAMVSHARDSNTPPIDLGAECNAAGLDPATIQPVINQAMMASDGQIAAPGLGRLSAGIVDDVSAMLRAVEAGAPSEGRTATDRMAALTADGLPADTISAEQIAKLTAVPADGGESLHRLVMDLHKILNRLAASCAEEMIAGAHAFGLRPEDKTLVEAFMRGVERTRALKFDHPGLDTTATRSGSQLTIQNDIGATDAHVVVISVDKDCVSVTYTDVHLARSKFFVGLFDEFRIKWSGLDRQQASGLANGGEFYLVTGRYEAETADDCKNVLEAIGAALVFLIDWNKARKALRLSVSNGDAIRILAWAARNRVGHRAFLELGGSELVALAVRNAASSRIGFGQQLISALGREAAVNFLKGVLRISTEALLEGRSVRLVRDRIEADLIRHLDRAGGTLLAIVVRQAGLARDVAMMIAHHLADLQSGRQVDGDALAARARRIEEKADRIAIDARSEVARFDAGRTVEGLVNRVEEAIDELEQAAFITSLLPPDIEPALPALVDLCVTAGAGAEAAAIGADAAIEVPEGHRSDYEDALAAVARLVDIEHVADASERAITKLVLRGGLGLTASLSIMELARALERATDRLAAFAHLLRQRVLADLSA